MRGYFKEFNKNKYLTLVPPNKSKEKKYKKLWSKNSDDYDKIYMKIKYK